MSKLGRQMVKELRDAWRVWALLGPDAHAVGTDALQSAAKALSEDLEGEEGSRAAESVLGALWGRGEPTAEWWRSPLGRAVGLALVDDVPVTQQMAADILGVQRGTVGVLVKRGALDQVAKPRAEVGPGRPAGVNQVSLRGVISRLIRLEEDRG